jgi:hypothetical protein
MARSDNLRAARIVFNALIVACVVAGLAIELYILGPAMALTAFTIQSNLLALLAAAATLAREARRMELESKGYFQLKGAAVASILLTFVVYNWVLAPYFTARAGDYSSSFASGLANNLLHTTAPLLMFADYLIFDKKGDIKAWHPVVWAAFPIYYLLFTAAYKVFGGVYKFGKEITYFPYFFLDYTTYGARTVGLWIALIVAGFMGFSYLLLGLDQAIAKIRKRL